MNRSSVVNWSNSELIEANHQRWQRDPSSVDETWRAFFAGYELATKSGTESEPDAESNRQESSYFDAARLQAAVTRLIDGYREIGHYLADLDPLRLNPPLDSHELLDLSAFGLSEADLDKTFYSRLTDPPASTLRELLTILRQTYCGKIGVEYMHIRDKRIRTWIQERIEPTRNQPRLDSRKKRRIVLKLYAAELFETFLHSHYIGQKRFSLEGGGDVDPVARRDHRACGEGRGARDCDGDGASRPVERARQHS